MRWEVGGLVLDGLSGLARGFVARNGVRVGSWGAGEYRRRWGGLVLPPGPAYDGGPKVLAGDVPEEYGSGEWRFDAGEARSAIPYGFLIGAAGEFGIHCNGRPWVALHGSVEGWIESLALADHAARWARQVTRLTGDQVDALDLVPAAPDRVGVLRAGRARVGCGGGALIVAAELV